MLNYWLPKSIIGTIKNKKMAKPKNVIIGIYKITSPSGKVYIGQSVNIHKRKNSYSKLHCKTQPKIYKSLNKYGWDNHLFDIIEECFIDRLDERETFWKIHYLEQVNNDWTKVLFCDLHDTGGGPKSEETKSKLRGQKRSEEVKKNMKHSEETIRKMTGVPKSDETKIKMSEAAKGKPGHFLGGHHSDKTKLEMSEYRKGKPSSFLGHHHSYETKIKLSISAKKRPFIFVPGHKHSEETKLKMREPRPSIYKPILQFDLDNNFIQEWPSLKSAKEQLKLNHSSLSDCLNMKRETCGGFKWKFLN